MCIVAETAMGVSKSTQDQSGFEYAMAVMKMCDILHLRHTKIWLRPEMLFNLTQYAKNQTKLLDVIHGLTKKVIITYAQDVNFSSNDLSKTCLQLYANCRRIIYVSTILRTEYLISFFFDILLI